MTEPIFIGRTSFLACTCFRFSFRFATHANSLALASRRTLERWLRYVATDLSIGHFHTPEPFCALACCHCVISGLFTPLSGNFSTFARDTNALSVWESYLDLPVDAGMFICPIRGILLFLLHSSRVRIRGYHPLWQSVPSHFCSARGYSAPHLPCFAGYSAWSSRRSITFTNRMPIGLFSFPY